MAVSRAFLSGASAKHFPKATVSCDCFQLFALGNMALDEVRLAGVRSQPDLKATRWSLLENPSAWTTSQPQTIHGLSRSNHKTARSPGEARSLFPRWLGWARRCRLNPFKRLARTITNHLTRAPSGLEAGKHNGRVEAIDRVLGGARTHARRYRRVENSIDMAYLVAGKPNHLPAPPFPQLTVVPHERS